MEFVHFIVNERKLKIQATAKDATRLKNDDEFAINYITDLVLQNKLNPLNLYAHDANSLNIVRENIIHEETEESAASLPEDVIWTKKGKPTQLDIDAVDLMLQLRAKENYSKMFDNKKTVKLQLWTQIANEMEEAGFNVGPRNQRAEKLRQKFLNLSKIYTNYNSYIKNTTGTSPKPAPDFYEAIHAILGDKHKANPKNINNSMPCTSATVETDTNSEAEECINGEFEENIINVSGNNTTENLPASNSYINRFDSIKKTVRPGAKENIFSKIKELHEENMIINREQNEKIENLIKEQNELLREQNKQRDKLISLFEIMVKPKKRKRSNSSSGSES